MLGSTKPLTLEEAQAIKNAEPLFIEKITVHGTYKSGVPFVREYGIGTDLQLEERIRLNYIIGYPDPLNDPMEGFVQ